MKANLMFARKDLERQFTEPSGSEALVQDLGLALLWEAMAAGDARIAQVARQATLLGLTDPADITYRQEVLADCQANPGVARHLYKTAVEALEAERREIWGLSRGAPQVVLYRATESISLFVKYLKELRETASTAGEGFASEGFKRLLAMLQAELDEEYLDSVEAHLRRLRFRNGVLIGSELGPGLTSRGHVLLAERHRRWPERLLQGRSGYSFDVPARDEAGGQVLGELHARAVNLVANATAQAAEHVKSFLEMVATELAFYVGCLNLSDRLRSIGAPVCFPELAEGDAPALSADGLYDVGLALRLGSAVTANDLRADGKLLAVVTGANQGGKSTFLRSVGLAQAMMQSGMFVGASRLRADLRTGIFTHFKREEDATMTSGKFDEELVRMSAIADAIAPGGLLLCNESLASTNEQEGSDIALEVIRAMVGANVKVVFVTHMFELASRALDKPVGPTVSLRAERLADGRRTFRIVEGGPLPTSYGEDIYSRVFSAGGTQ